MNFQNQGLFETDVIKENVSYHIIYTYFASQKYTEDLL